MNEDMQSSDIPVLIPAYKPGEPLVQLVRDLVDRGITAIVVVDDGGGPEFQAVFNRIEVCDRVHVVRHAVNLGKGAALKTGMNYALVRFPDCIGVVTADADGQHHPDDIVLVAEKLRLNPDSLVMGVRAFDRDVPLRSRIGNNVTAGLMRLLVGQKLPDTQTGLRGIPASLIPHLLKMLSSGYEFELDMLIACKHQSCRIVEQPIRTIYLDGTQSSHFHPVFDSMRIYFLLFRFGILSFATALLDNAVFFTMYSATGRIGQSQIAARVLATAFSYLTARRAVFHSQQKHSTVLPKFLLLVFCNGMLSYGLIEFLHFSLGVATFSAKLLAEGLLFIGNFAIQRDFVFTKRPSRAA
jgi:glycosyltransferase involved in cell wall biosynthesis